ncbi:DUF4292 domain-containing protein [bacterium SCSIO 12741]|nr:DUF4292 domain-containing protein [bacterium SCSIO 12741]
MNCTKSNGRSLTWLVVISLALVFSSCKSKRDSGVINFGNTLPKMTEDELMTKVSENEVDAEYLNLKTKVYFKTPKLSDSFKMHVRMKKDSVIWVSATYYKVEVARFLMFPDSVKMIDRKNGKYYLGDYAFVQNRFKMPFDFYSFQSIILGNSFDLSKSEKTRTYSSRGQYLVSSLQTREYKTSDTTVVQHQQNYTIWVDPESYKVTKSRISESKTKKNFVAEFSEHQQVNDELIPHKARYFVKDEEEMEFRMEVLKLTVNEKTSFPFNISSKYEPFF